MTETDASYIDVIGIGELPAGTQKTVFIHVTRVLLCHTREGIYAVEDKCSHAFQPLAGGEIRDGNITCPKHGACFDLATGKSLNQVTARPVKTFKVRIHAERIELQLNPSNR